jgi:hypothetical protein
MTGVPSAVTPVYTPAKVRSRDLTGGLASARDVDITVQSSHRQSATH